MEEQRQLASFSNKIRGVLIFKDASAKAYSLEVGGVNVRKELNSMRYLVSIAGVLLVALGAWIIVSYWGYYLRVLAMRCGWGRIKFSSMTPLAGPVLVILGALLFGQPLNKIVGFWIFLVDMNTYTLAISLVALCWSNIHSAK